MIGGGAERVALRLAADFLAAGNRVDLVLGSAQGQLMGLVPEQVRVIDLDARRMRDAVRPLIRYLREERPDAVQVSMWPLTVVAVVAHRLARSRARLVLSDHVALSKQYGGWAFRLLRATVPLFYPLADARVLVSRGAAEDMTAFSGIPRDQLEVIYNPVAGPPANLAPDQRIEALWGEDGVRRIITVGTLKEQKNHALLIRAFAKLRASSPAKLMILGEGPLREMLRDIAAAEGVTDDVLMPGFAIDPWPYYRSADLFVLSSDYEGFGLVLIEAMRAGLPIVSTDCESGPSEILDGGRFGFLVPVGDAVALADAMARALSVPVDKPAIMARAEALSGQAASNRYLELMLGERL